MTDSRILIASKALMGTSLNSGWLVQVARLAVREGEAMDDLNGSVAVMKSSRKGGRETEISCS